MSFIFLIGLVQCNMSEIELVEHGLIRNQTDTSGDRSIVSVKKLEYHHK